MLQSYTQIIVTLGLLVTAGCLPWGKARLCEPTPWYRDDDGDGYGDAKDPTEACGQPDGYVADGTDCDDSDRNSWKWTGFFVDADGDGFGDETGGIGYACAETFDGKATNNDDCDDGDAATLPGAEDLICGDGIDRDCDGADDCTVSSEVEVTEVALWSSAGSVLGGGSDIDKDGYYEAMVGNPAEDTVTVIWSMSGEDFGATEIVGQGGSEFGAAMGALDDGLVVAAPAMGIVYAFDEYDSEFYGLIEGDWDFIARLGHALLPLRGSEGGVVAYYDTLLCDEEYGSPYEMCSLRVADFSAWPTNDDRWSVHDSDCRISTDLTDGGVGYADAPVPRVASGHLWDDCDETLALAGLGYYEGSIELYCCNGSSCCGDDSSVLPSVEVYVHSDRPSSVAFIPKDVSEPEVFAVGVSSEGDSGTVYLVFDIDRDVSHTDIDSLDDAVVLQGTDSDELGAAITPAGDMNGDGFAELAIGAPGVGRVDVYLGPLTLGDEPILLGSIWGKPGFGSALHSPGDVDGDGYDDLLVASEDDNVTYLIPGGPER